MDFRDKTKEIFKIKHWEYIKILLVMYDVLAVTLSFAFALWVRYDFRYSTIPQEFLYTYIKFAPIYAIFSVVCFRFFKLYSSIWRFASYRELEKTVFASIVCFVFHFVGQRILFGQEPIVYYFLGILLQFLSTLGIRFSYRFLSLIKKRKKDERNGKALNVMIIGAGEVGKQIVHSINERNITGSKACCIIDDNPNKWDRYIEGIPVVGDRNTIAYNVEKYEIDKIYFCIANVKAKNRQEILEICKETGKPVMNVPPINEIDRNDISEKILKPVTIEDLLNREPVNVATEEILSYVKDKTIMITGGGGSIGSELARQIASHQPKCLILLDIYENTVYELQQDLLAKYPTLNLKAVIASVCDSRRMMSVFKKYKPDVVYHAAAHKHVPLMEYSPHEAIKNNTVGTYKTAYAALMNGCKRFVLISTDKAVNPTNIMGASKRLCEMIIQSFDYMVKHGIADRINPLRFHTDKESDVKNAVIPEKFVTEFVAVRFGNVLGSNGSVIPLFKKQIARGGPVTVTHPDIIRYFMTIPEAASLVLLAGTYAKGGEIFVLDMGDPVKIDTLARNLIMLSGYKPDVDIKIEYTGLRPGEKLYEEKLMAEEGMQKTVNDKIHIGKPIEFDMEAFIQKLDGLMMMSYDDDADIISAVSELVPTYIAGEKVSEVPNKEKYNSLLKKAEGKS